MHRSGHDTSLPKKPLGSRSLKNASRPSGSSKQTLTYSNLEPRAMLAALPVISEFVASNNSSLVDGFGESPDWIEIHNAGDAAVDLNGYHLTDDSSIPDRWTFGTSTVLDPGDYLIVFASGNATPDPEGNLHTNFSLSANGEYLALSNPGGTLLSEFGSSTTEYPAQDSDESYGLAFNSSLTEVVTPTSNAQYLIPSNNSVDAIWTGNNFDDSGWQSGSASIGYEETPADFDDLIITSVPEGTTTLYTRMQFNVTDPNTLLGTLQMKYDDGFIAYLNGTRIASANAPATGAFNSTATDQHGDSQAVEYVDFDVTDFSDQLVVGTNTLAIHLLNRNSGSSDFLSVPNLITTTGNLILPTVEGQLIAPTPGQPNTNVLGTAVQLSRVGGVFENPFQLTMMSSGQNETIRYTTNGSQPTASSPVYNGPITLTASTQIRARTFGASGQVGPITVESYSRTDSTTGSFTSDLPIIVIENYGAGVPGDGDFEDAALALYDVDDTTGRSSLASDADVTSLIGQHRRGSSTLNNPKPNLRIETRDASGDDQNVSWLDLPSESDWILTGPYRFDRALIRDSLLHDLSNQIGRYSVRTRFVEVYGNYNGGTLTNSDYLGVYVLMENIKIDEDRVDIADLEPTDNTEPDITGGYIIKIDRGSGWETTRGVPNRGGASFVNVEPERADLTTEQTNYIRGYVQDLEDALYGPNSTDPELGYEAWLDVEASIDHHIIRTLSLEPDSLGLSTFLTKDRDGKLAFGPLWDFDRSMGSDGDLRSSDVDAWFSGVDFFEFDWWGELFKDPDFKQQWIDRWHELRMTTFSDANIMATLNGQAAQLVEAQARNFARWPENPPNGGEYADAGLTGWEAEVSHLAGWLMARVAWIDGQLIPAPTLVTDPGNVSAGSQVTLGSNQSGSVIFYTTDRSDPRDEGGGLSASAVQYTGPFTVNATTQIVARTFGTPAETDGQTPDTSSWSNAVDGLYSIETPASASNLRISELHFHPADPTTGELIDVPGTDEDDYEFVELLNISNETISLNGVTLGVAVNFDFTTASITSLAPGQTVLVVNNIAAFEARYGTGFPIAGEYAGKFSDSSEQVTLTDSLDQVIHDFTYSDSTPWPTGADGDGPSLEVIDPSGDLSDPTNWRVSATVGGTPAVIPAAFAPQVTSLVRDGGNTARPDQLQTLSITFDSNVSVGASDLTLRNDTTGGLLIDISGSGFIYDTGSRTATWDLSVLPDMAAAFYTVILSDDVTAVSGGLALDGDADGTDGGDYQQSIYVAIPGDANLDGTVNVLGDGFALVSNLGLTGGGTWALGDFNADGNVNVLGDGFALVSNLGISVVPPVNASVSGLASLSAVSIQSSVVQPNPIIVAESDDEDDPVLAAKHKVDAATDPQLAGDQATDAAFESEFAATDSFWV